MVTVLSSRVTDNLLWSEAARRVGNVLSSRGLKSPAEQTCRRALKLWLAAPRVRDFVDVLSMAPAERLRIRAVASFDEDLVRVPTVKRLTP